MPAVVLSGQNEADALNASPGDGAAVPDPQWVEDPRPLVADDAPLPPAPAMADVVVPDGGAADGPTSLSDALPDGEDFERGLASLMGTDADEPSEPRDDDELNRTFWGQLAGRAERRHVRRPGRRPSRRHARLSRPTRLATTRSLSRSRTVPPPPPADTAADGAASPPDWEPAPDWLDGELASLEPTPAAAAAASAAAPEPPPAPAAAAPLIRRQPRATLTDDVGSAAAPVAGGPRTASTRRSPEEVRAMLSRYRRGIEDGRQSPGSED